MAHIYFSVAQYYHSTIAEKKSNVHLVAHLYTFLAIKGNTDVCLKWWCCNV